jgi:hypothetical protein
LSYDGLEGQGTRRFIDANLPLYMTIEDSRTQAARGILTVVYKIVESKAPFYFRKYVDASKQKPIADAAVATIPIGDRNVGFVLASQEDGSIGMSLVLEPTTAKKQRGQISRPNQK